MTNPCDELGRPRLLRRLGLLPATALNMSNVVGVGPFVVFDLVENADDRSRH